MSLRARVRDFRCIESGGTRIRRPLQPDQRRERLGQDQPARGDFLSGPRTIVPHARNETLIRKGADELHARPDGWARSTASDRSACGTAARASKPGPPGDASAAWRSWRPFCPCRRSTPRCTGWWRRARRSGGGTSTGGVPRGTKVRRALASVPAALKQRNAALRAEAAGAGGSRLGPRTDRGGHSARCFAATVLRAAAAARGRGGRAAARHCRRAEPERWLGGRHRLAETRSLSWPRDRERGTTHAGPHRADLSHPRRRRPGAAPGLARTAEIDGRGDAVGTARCDAALGSPTAALLVDDPAAELDAANLERLISVVLELPGQLFVTALDPAMQAFQAFP